ncbi:MAG: glycerophosphodiester phosphodiesterase [Oscillospiraceae bacterium]|nr:glycerophosphodiester phosphodiesterase [Oscillospiraceae bacterium]
MPLVIAHRGANLEAPENTLPAFERALAYSVHGFENDVHITADGVLVVIHDDTIDRTSNGTGLVCEMTYDQLMQYDYGSWFSPEFAGTKIPTLQEFFALCHELPLINVEIKAEPNGSKDAAAAVVKLAKECGVFDNLLVSSFDMDMLQNCLAEDPATRVAFLYAPDNEEACDEICDCPVTFAQKYNLSALHPFVPLCNPDFIEECCAAGIMVNPWTVNQEHAITALRNWGAHAVITDEPALAMGICC